MYSGIFQTTCLCPRALSNYVEKKSCAVFSERQYPYTTVQMYVIRCWKRYRPHKDALTITCTTVPRGFPQSNKEHSKTNAPHLKKKGAQLFTINRFSTKLQHNLILYTIIVVGTMWRNERMRTVINHWRQAKVSQDHGENVCESSCSYTYPWPCIPLSFPRQYLGCSRKPGDVCCGAAS